MNPLPERLAKARMGVILDAPFFGSLLMRLPMVRDDAAETFCTDGRTIRYNQEFLDSLDDSELRGVLVHEVCHPAQGHLWRMGHRHLEKWNHACDYAVNQLLDDYANECRAKNRPVPWTLPEGTLLDKKLSDGLSSEEIYNRLPDPPPRGGNGSGCGQPGGKAGPGQFEAPKDANGNPLTKEALEQLAGDWKIATVQAANAAKSQGNCPASIRRFIDELVDPKIPWRELLREFLRRPARDDFSWRRPCRRYAHQGLILPGVYSEQMGRFLIAVDTSGSITKELLAEFQSEVQSALDETRPEAIDVVYCDAAINQIEEFRPDDTVQLEMKGGGGTSFVPVFEHAAAMDEPPVAIVYLTDLAGTFPDEPPDIPTMWANYGDGDKQPPFGELVKVA